MTGGAVGSLFAQFVHLTADERNTLHVAGAAAGMAATFNAPLASVLLAVELLLFEWRPRSYVPVAAAVGVATVVHGYLLGTGPLFVVPDVPVRVDAAVVGLSAVSGLACGLLAIGATALVYASEDGFARLPVHWMWWPAIGGLIIGVGGLIVPQALGVGYNVIGAELDGSIGLGLVVGILVVKTLIWSLSLGSGTSGGVLAPMFMVGGALGALEAHVFPTVAPGFWPLVGLAGVLGGLMRAPLTGVAFAVELTHRVDAVLPLLVGASAAYALSAVVLKRSVLTEKVARRGYHLSREYDVDPLEVLFVREVMTTAMVTFPSGARLEDVVRTFVSQRRQTRDPQHRQRLYPIVTDDGWLAGVITRRDVLDCALDDSGRSPSLEELVNASPSVAFPDETLRTVAYRMADAGLTRLPVVAAPGDHRLVGLITLPQLLEARLRDLREERESERVLTFRPIGPARWPRPARRGTKVPSC
jgi:CBS domain-containing protein